MRPEMEEFFDIGMRFAGFGALIKGLKASGLASLDNIKPGQIVILSKDPTAAESLSLYRAQSYQLTSIYYQKPGELSRKEVDSLTKSPPDQSGAWELWVELFSEDYHSGPVRCRRSEVEFRTVSEELVDSLKIAIPTFLFWATVCFSMITVADIKHQ